MHLKNISLLRGKDLAYVPSARLQVSDGAFKGIKTNHNTKERAVDCEGLLLVPGFVNMHTHVGDSIAKDAVLSGTVDSKIHPVLGAKQRILRNSKPEHLAAFMKNACQSMLYNGITTFVDFREGGLDGVRLLKKAATRVPIRAIVLGRLEYYQDKAQIQKNVPIDPVRKKELKEILKESDGIGISGANENSDLTLQHYATTKKIRAIHSAETKESTSKSKQITKKPETLRALKLRPHFLVHMTFATKTDLVTAAKLTRGIVICPRANAALAEGIPDYAEMKQAGCTVAIGTDNVMVNSPDMFKEMDYLWKVTMGIRRHGVDPKEILQMATVNGGKLLGKKIGSIEDGYAADGIFVDKHAIDLEPMHNPHASIVQRATKSDVRAVMVGGRIVHGSI